MAIPGDIQQPGGQVQPSRRRRPKWRIAALVVSIFALLLVADWWQENREMGHLLTAVESSQESVRSGNTGLKELTDNYTYVDQSHRQDFISRGESVCSDAAANVQEIGVTIKDVRILPWHSSLDQARWRYLDFNDVALRMFRNCAEGPHTVGGQAVTSELKATYRVAHRSFQAAVPFLPLNRSPERIAAIFWE